MKIKNNNRQRYNSIQGLRSFKDTLPTKVKKIIVKKGEIYSKTLENWKYLVGDELFQICYPKSFKKINQRNKCLLIMVQRGFEVELEYAKQKIIDKINYFFGKEIVSRLRTQPSDPREKRLKEDLVFYNFPVFRRHFHEVHWVSSVSCQVLSPSTYVGI